MRINFTVLIFAAFSAFAAQEDRERVSHFFYEVHLQARRAVNLMQESVMKDLQELWHEQRLIAGDLASEAQYTVEKVGNFFYEADRFRGILDESIKNMSAEFVECFEKVPSVKPRLEKFLSIVRGQNKAQFYEESAAKILGSAYKGAGQSGAPVPRHDIEISEKTVCDYRTLLVVVGCLREHNAARRAAMNELVDAILYEVSSAMKDCWSVLPVMQATSLLKRFDEGRGFWRELPNHQYYNNDPDDIADIDAWNFSRAQVYGLQRYLILKILDSGLAEYVDQPAPGGGDGVKAQVLVAAKIILSGMWPKVKEDLLNPLPVESLSELATQNGAVARALPAIKRILPDFSLALANCPGVRERIIAAAVQTHNNREENKVIVQKFVKTENFLDGVIMLKNRILRQQINICDLEDHLRQMLHQHTKEPNGRNALDIMRREDTLREAADAITIPGLIAQDVVTRLLREGLSLCAQKFMLTIEPVSSEGEAMQT